MSTLLTADDLAERWQVRIDHIYRLAREGHIPTVAIGRYRRFRLEAIEAWETAQETPARAASGGFEQKGSAGSTSLRSAVG